MKEIDIIKHAKSYMDMLSAGVNPITKEQYPKSSDLNNERLIKCFEFVSEILDRVIKEEIKKEENSQTHQTVSSINDASESFPPNSLVSEEITGRDVVNTLIEKGLLKQGVSKKDQPL